MARRDRSRQGSVPQEHSCRQSEALPVRGGPPAQRYAPPPSERASDRLPIATEDAMAGALQTDCSHLCHSREWTLQQMYPRIREEQRRAGAPRLTIFFLPLLIRAHPRNPRSVLPCDAEPWRYAPAPTHRTHRPFGQTSPEDENARLTQAWTQSQSLSDRWPMTRTAEGRAMPEYARNAEGERSPASGQSCRTWSVEAAAPARFVVRTPRIRSGRSEW